MDALQAYLAKCPVRKVPKGRILVLQDEVPTRAYVVKHGTIKIYNLTSNGQEKSLSFSTEYELFPVCWVFSQTERALFFYQAYTDCEVYIIDKQDFTDYLEATPQLAYFLLAKQVEMYISNSLRVNALAQTKASSKLLCALRHLCLRHGKEVEKDRVHITIPLTQQEIANIIGLTRETTVLELNKLKKLKILVTDHKYYTINTRLLNERLDDEYNPGILLGHPIR